ncbi:MAG: trypsin-like peptidase domain-containing protein [Candidatus Bathyarchaeia archaeon]
MKSKPRSKKSVWPTTTIAVLLLVIVVLGSVALYYSPVLDGLRPRNLTPDQIYAISSQGVVTIQGVVQDLTLSTYPNGTLSPVLGTGFVINYGGSYYIVTNYHVIQGLLYSTVTFSNGDSFPAKVLGSDAYSDIAVVSVNATPSEFHPLQLGSSAGLKVGETVVAIGNPYGLSNTVTVGVVSQVGRALQTDTLGGFAIPDTVQFSAAVNPGNSGGPVIAPDDTVVGITSASVTNSEGLGFAIPSDTITREIPSLIKSGKYDKHPYLGLGLIDMTYQLSQAMGTNVTYGVLVESIVPGGPASTSGLRAGTQNATIQQQEYIVGGDVIVSINGNKITNYDSFSAYLEEHAVAGQTIQLGIIRNGQYMVLSVLLGSRPPLSA